MKIECCSCCPSYDGKQTSIEADYACNGAGPVLCCSNVCVGYMARGWSLHNGRSVQLLPMQHMLLASFSPELLLNCTTGVFALLLRG